MMLEQFQINRSLQGRGFYNITEEILSKVAASTIKTGLCHVFLQHTSASLILCEKADSAVLTDLETFIQRLVPDGDGSFQHQAEGPDDMAAHIRTVLTGSSLTIPITYKRLALGTWQGIFVWEHRLEALERKLFVTLQGVSN